MTSALWNFWTSFSLGLLTPLTAVCVLPLYPGFLVYLTNQASRDREESERKSIFMFGLIIVAGVILFMFLLGLVFTTLLQASLTKVVGIVSPIAFGLLLIISLLLIFDVEFGRFFPTVQAPVSEKPLLNAFLFGFFFGAIVVPCNPGFISALFARSLLATGFAQNTLSFLFFGVGIGFPLLFLSTLSTVKSRQVIRFLTFRKRVINLGAGLIMLGISLYYLIIVFDVLGVWK